LEEKRVGWGGSIPEAAARRMVAKDCMLSVVGWALEKLVFGVEGWWVRMEVKMLMRVLREGYCLQPGGRRALK